jgi:alpha-glucosidase
MKKIYRRRMLPASLLFFIWMSAFESKAVFAAWQTAGDVANIAKEADSVTLQLSSGAQVFIKFINTDTIRVRLAPSGKFERDFSYAVEERPRRPVNLNVNETADAIEITTRGGARILVNRRPFLINVYDTKGQIIVADDPARPTMFDVQSGAFETSKRRASQVEMYYGFGEKAMPMSRHDQYIVNWNSDTPAYPRGLDPVYETIPFFIALNEGRAYGLFFDNTYRTFFDMGKTAPERYTFGAAGGELNYYIFTGGATRTPKEVLYDYTSLTGRAPLPPVWSLGYQQSRWSYYPESRVRELAQKFRAEKVPADAIYLDIDYMDGFRVFTWDKTRFPDPAKMLADLRAQGFRTVVIIDPGIKTDANYGAYKTGRDGGFFVKDASGKEFHATVWPGECAFPDFTDAKARAWFGTLYKKDVEDGIAGFWNDMNEPATFLPDNLNEPNTAHHPGKTFPLDVQHAGDGVGGTHARYHNVYGMQMARATFEGVKALRPDARPFVLTRAGYAGMQRYAAMWTGDNASTWEHLQLTIPMLTNIGVSGVPFCGADIGGFIGEPSPELYTRWMEAAALTPLMRSHVDKANRDREPWMHGEPYASINRKTIELRYQLLPFLYTLFHEHERTGAPPMRPLWFEYPNDVGTYLIEDEFLLGRDLLVAPVVHDGERKRSVRFPKGDAWIDWWTGARYEGGTTAMIDAPLDRLPLFQRAGSSIPTQPVIQNTDEMKNAPLTVTIAQMPADNASIYEDAGDGYAQADGVFRMTGVVPRGTNEFLITHDTTMTGARAARFVEIIGVNAPPQEIRVNDTLIKDVTFDAERHRLHFAVPDNMVNRITLK